MFKNEKEVEARHATLRGPVCPSLSEADDARDGRRYVELSALKRRGVATWSDEQELGELERRMTLRDARRFARKGDSGDG